MSQEWMILTDAKVVQYPMPLFTEDGAPIIDRRTGEQKVRFIRQGVRIDFLSGEYWVLSYKSGTWTRHWEGVETCGCGQEGGCGFSDCPYIIEHKESYSPHKLRREYGDRPEFLDQLELGVRLAQVRKN